MKVQAKKRAAPIRKAAPPPPPPEPSSLRRWMMAAEPEEQIRLAELAGTSRAYLYMLAADGKRYQRQPRTELAAAIERGTERLHKATRGRLPRVYRTDLVQTCAQCPYALQCSNPRETK